MKAALIPPLGLEHWALMSNFHLALAIPSTMGNAAYVSTYQAAAHRGDFIIVDNGAAEGQMASNEYLMDAAGILGASEVVAPDAIGNQSETVVRVANFINWYKQSDYFAAPRRIMAVAQGSTFDEYKRCVEAYLHLDTIDTIGIPRDLLPRLRRATGRIELAEWINKEFPGEFQLHFLGTWSGWLREIQDAARNAPFVRSVDSGLAFNYALARQDLRKTRLILARHDSYFDYDWSHFEDEPTVRSNVNTYIKWATGE